MLFINLNITFLSGLFSPTFLNKFKYPHGSQDLSSTFWEMTIYIKYITLPNLDNIHLLFKTI